METENIIIKATLNANTTRLDISLEQIDDWLIRMSQITITAANRSKKYNITL